MAGVHHRAQQLVRGACGAGILWMMIKGERRKMLETGGGKTVTEGTWTMRESRTGAPDRRGAEQQHNGVDSTYYKSNYVHSDQCKSVFMGLFSLEMVVLTLLVMTVLVSIALMIRRRRNALFEDKKKEAFEMLDRLEETMKKSEVQLLDFKSRVDKDQKAMEDLLRRNELASDLVMLRAMSKKGSMELVGDTIALPS
ncbi:hypothetical protein GUITHDRAFT_112261 [Guillardia theta CCMP2712]|uniref:Uncharacterized protein n=1 Tax=Guillardia theta (strain CCMP2712) TaxID=905079 RepID=L1J067_GUITC|nr:hypothetical protein GUITHDRAFT_112261 [Guillardia theta CCMP2712]EKX41549.1 hypothetical protein GUITHDRAFT_112261 [Guillardia theta CCMP2712]|eukprot:XP_005828529.1 hypothetical protein GUITHDRAFT_112261 [Guillardia theta CCMP2712]